MERTDELEDILLKAEQVLAKSNQIISGQSAEKQQPKSLLANVQPKKAAPDPRRSKPVVSSSHKPMHLSAPFKTQALNLFGNKKPQFPVKRSSVAKTGQAPMGSRFVRSNSASSVQATAPAAVPERKSQANPPALSESPATAVTRMVKDLRVGQGPPKPKPKAPQISSQEKARRENQLCTVRNVQNLLKENLELKRKVLVSTRKPCSARANFLSKVQSTEAPDNQVRSTSVFKVHQASVLYQRLGCLIRREMAPKELPDDQSEADFHQLKALLDQMKQADRLISRKISSCFHLCHKVL